MKHKIVLAFVVVVLAGMSLTAALSAQGDPAGSTHSCPDFGRLDYNYACQYGGWWPPAEAVKLDTRLSPDSSVRVCPDFGRLNYNYACQYGSWRPSVRALKFDTVFTDKTP